MGVKGSWKGVKEFPVVTLCGSTRFKTEFEKVNAELTRAGKVVISVGVFGHADGVSLTIEEKKLLDRVHMQKIDMADEIFVINVGGYIGESTQREIEYATKLGLPITYWTPVSAIGG